MTDRGFGVVAYLGVWLTTCGGIWFLFEKADETLAPDVRHKVTVWLRSENVSDGDSSWPHFFLSLFDRTFGERHVSWHCFQRSAVASMCTTWLVALLWMIPHPPQSVLFGLSALFAVTLLAVVLNLLPDYLSLLETRWVLGRVERSKRRLGLLLLDLVATGTIALVGYAILYGAHYGPSQVPERLWGLISFQAHLAAFGPGKSTADLASAGYSIPLGVFFYSTFFTSAWAWLFALSGVGVRLVARLRGMSARLWRITDVEAKPFRSLGLAAVILVTVMFLAAAPVALVLRGAG